jgi:diguanylate cyclase (GGDEF)-like protein
MHVPQFHLMPAERVLVRLYRRTGKIGVVSLIAGVSVLASVLATYWLVAPLLTPEDVANGMRTRSIGIAVLVPLLVAPAATLVLVSLLVRLDDAYRQVLVLSSTDPLTSVANRRGLFSAADARLRDRVDSQAYLVGMVDVNNFKRLNDEHGHTLGDRVLVETARRLQAISESAGAVGRIGGDEFAFLLTAPLKDIERLADRLHDQCGAFGVAGDRRATPVPVTTSIGIVRLEPGESFGQALMRADDALFGR